MEITRDMAVDYLNHRLENEIKFNPGYFDEKDLEFIINFIYVQANEMVNVNHLIFSIKNYENSCMSWMERLYNHLVFKYDIEIETKSTTNVFNSLMGTPQFKIINYK